MFGMRLSPAGGLYAAATAAVLCWPAPAQAAFESVAGPLAKQPGAPLKKVVLSSRVTRAVTGATVTISGSFTAKRSLSAVVSATACTALRTPGSTDDPIYIFSPLTTDRTVNFKKGENRVRVTLEVTNTIYKPGFEIDPNTGASPLVDAWTDCVGAELNDSAGNPLTALSLLNLSVTDPATGTHV